MIEKLVAKTIATIEENAALRLVNLELSGTKEVVTLRQEVAALKQERDVLDNNVTMYQTRVAQAEAANASLIEDRTELMAALREAAY